MFSRRQLHFLACWRFGQTKLGAGKRQQPKVIAVDAVSARWAGTAIARAMEVIDSLPKASANVSRARIFRKLRVHARNIVDSPVPPHARRGVGIIAEQHEAAGLWRRAAPLQRRRDIFSVAGETGRDGAAV